MQTTIQILTAAATVLAAACAAWLAATKLVGGTHLRSLVAALLDERARYRHPVVVAATTTARAFTLAQALGERGFKSVRVIEADDAGQVDPKGAVVVFGADNGADLAARQFGPLGVIYVEGRATSPRTGDWSYANSRVTLHARVLECIEYAKAGAQQ